MLELQLYSPPPWLLLLGHLAGPVVGVGVPPFGHLGGLGSGPPGGLGSGPPGGGHLGSPAGLPLL